MSITAEKVREIAYQCAGVGSGAVMKEAPTVVMPEKPITAGVEAVLRELCPEAASTT
jgi:hypothetical protein